jgi:non-heme chloroperoxidase
MFDADRRRALRTLCASLAASAAPLASVGAQTPGEIAASAPELRDVWFATSDGVRLHALAHAPQTADAGRPPVRRIVFLPGWCIPARIWRPQLEDIGARWPCLALDPRGQGESDIPRAGYTVARRADDLHEVLAANGRTVLVAWSLGVLEALECVHRHGSALVDALVLVDNSIGEPPAPKPTDFVQRLRRDRQGTVDGFVRSMFRHAPPDFEIAALRESALRMPLEGSIDLLSKLPPREHWRELVHRYEGPLAYVVTPHLREQARNLLAARPQSRIEVFEDAGHALFVDDAQRFNRLLTDWVAAL